VEMQPAVVYGSKFTCKCSLNPGLSPKEQKFKV